MPKKTKPQGDIPYVPPGSTDPEGYEATSKEQKKARRAWAKQNQEYVLQELARGKTLAQLGISDEKEGGRSMYRMLAMRGQQGFQDPNFSYDWASGMKRNHATSDANAGWVPIEPREREEFERQQRFGTGPDAWIKSLQADSQAQLGKWADQNAVKGGALRKDEAGRLYMIGDDGQRIDFDAYGNLIDANTGQPIGDHQYGMGTDLVGAAAGYKSPFGAPGPKSTPGGGWTPEHPPTPNNPPPSKTGGPFINPPPPGGTPIGGRPGMGDPSGSIRPDVMGGRTPQPVPLARPTMGNAWNRTQATPMPSAPGSQGQAQPGQGVPGMGSRPPSLVESMTFRRQSPAQDPNRRRQAGGSVLANPYA